MFSIAHRGVLSVVEYTCILNRTPRCSHTVVKYTCVLRSTPGCSRPVLELYLYSSLYTGVFPRCCGVFCVAHRGVLTLFWSTHVFSVAHQDVCSITLRDELIHAENYVKLRTSGNCLQCCHLLRNAHHWNIYCWFS